MPEAISNTSPLLYLYRILVRRLGSPERRYLTLDDLDVRAPGAPDLGCALVASDLTHSPAVVRYCG